MGDNAESVTFTNCFVDSTSLCIKTTPCVCFDEEISYSSHSFPALNLSHGPSNPICSMLPGEGFQLFKL